MLLITANMLVWTYLNGVPFGMIVLSSVNCYQIDNFGNNTRKDLVACTLVKKRVFGISFCLLF
jgi:hypothetical protein